MKWIDLEQHLEQKSKHEQDREKNILAAREQKALGFLAIGESVYGWTLELCMHALKVNNDDEGQAGMATRSTSGCIFAFANRWV